MQTVDSRATKTVPQKTGHQSVKTKNSKKHNLQYFEYQTKIFLQSSFKMFSQLWWNGLTEVYSSKNKYNSKKWE